METVPNQPADEGEAVLAPKPSAKPPQTGIVIPEEECVPADDLIVPGSLGWKTLAA
ncbi:MAG: hypothetical protein ACREBO_00735 [Novosphingobium sp.]